MDHQTTAPRRIEVRQLGRVDYLPTWQAMQDFTNQRQSDTADQVWLCEHPPVFTQGLAGLEQHLLMPGTIPVVRTNRGGQITYHGPGQRVIYCMLDVGNRGRDVRCFVRAMENWVIATLAEFNVTGEVRLGRVGVWVDRTRPGGQLREDKIAAIGVRLKRWVSPPPIVLLRIDLTD